MTTLSAVATHLDLIRVLVPAALSFVVGMVLSPIVSHYLYLYKAWKKRPGKESLDGTQAAEFNRLHNVHETRAPRMGGIIIWGAVVITTLLTTAIALLAPGTSLGHLDFLSRSQTWIPLTALLIGSFVGLIDDLLMIGPAAEGMRLRYRLIIVFLLSLVLGWWFWDKLDVSVINLPFTDPLFLGAFVIPFFIIMTLGVYASGVIDGIDGLSGGVFASIFASYTIIAFAQNQINLAAFCAAIVGALLAFLWHNIPPARYYMSDTGTMGLTLALAVVAFMTDSLGGGVGVAVFPIIGALLVITVASVVLQMFWKRFFHKKLLRIAPLHHHFEAIGWPGPKVTMRYWVLSIVFAVAGVIIALASLATPVL
jgi:phospho-N-acetylmuramoyl-pentapeptide-transferase